MFKTPTFFILYIALSQVSFFGTLQAQNLTWKRSWDKAYFMKQADSLSYQLDISFQFGISEEKLLGKISPPNAGGNAKQRLLENKLKAQPNNPFILVDLYELATSESDRLKYKTATWENLQQQLEKSPQDAELNYALARYYTISQQPEEAYQAFVKTHPLMPDSVKLYRGIGKLLYSYQMFAPAKEAFADALRRNIEDLNLHVFFLMADISSQITEFRRNYADNASRLSLDARKAIDNLNIDNTFIQKLWQKDTKNESYQNLVQSTQLLSIYFRALFRMSTNPVLDTLKNISINEMFIVEKTELKALQQLEKYFKQALKKGKLPKKSFYLEALATIKTLQKNIKEATVLFEKAIKADAYNHNNYYNLVFLWASEKSFDKAIKIVQQKIQQTNTPFDWQLLAVIEHKRSQYKEALAYAEQGLKHFAENPNLLATKAVMLLKLQKNIAEAEALLAKANDMQPQDSQIILWWGIAQLAQEKHEAGFATLEKARILNNKEADKLLQYYLGE